ncbi:MAG: BON domain-containing protein [Burkholderiaceae bacterium]|jgi:osmotically-inducible protein OsmY
MKHTRPARRLAGALAVAAIAAALGGCAAAVVGGAVATGMVATDRRSTGAQLDDQNIELRAASSLSGTFGDRAHINVTSFNAKVLITGEVATEADKQQAFQIVSQVQGVRSVVNELAVMPVTSLSQRSSDSLITAKVKASMVDASDVFGTLFKVVTERNTVYLMGRVTQVEANRATEIARSVSGVQRVVRVLEIVTEAELKPPPPTPATPASSAPKS